MAKESDDSFIMSPHQAVELTPVGQGGESRTQAAAGVAVESSLAGETVPLAEEGQGNYLAAGQRGPGARSLLWGELVFAKIVGHHIKCGEKGVRVHHRAASRFSRFEANYRPLAPFLLE
jgi:hypothetical protein